MVAPLALVVEDDREIAEFFALTLREFGFVVEMIYQGRAALDRLAQVVPAIVILDLNIPLVTGVEVLHYIRGETNLAHTPVIVISANPHMIDQAYDLADLVLQKPVSYDQLRDLIRRFV